MASSAQSFLKEREGFEGHNMHSVNFTNGSENRQIEIQPSLGHIWFYMHAIVHK
jgi:hypothetical protein